MGGLEKGERRYGGANITEDCKVSFNRDQMTVATEADPRRIRDRRRSRLAAANTVRTPAQPAEPFLGHYIPFPPLKCVNWLPDLL
jgi:hypothetical protein